MICERAAVACAKRRDALCFVRFKLEQASVLAVKTCAKILREGSDLANTLLLQALLDIHQSKPMRVIMNKHVELEHLKKIDEKRILKKELKLTKKTMGTLLKSSEYCRGILEASGKRDCRSIMFTHDDLSCHCLLYLKFSDGSEENMGQKTTDARVRSQHDCMIVRVCEAPVLSMPTEKGMYVLDTDASVIAISGILNQKQEWNGTTVLRPIDYGSKVMSNTEMKYGAPKAEIFFGNHVLGEVPRILRERSF